MRRQEHKANPRLDSCAQEHHYAAHVKTLIDIDSHKHLIDATEPEMPPRLRVYNQQNSEAKKDILAQSNYYYSMIPHKGSKGATKAQKRSVKPETSSKDPSSDFFLTLMGGNASDFVDATSEKKRVRPMNMWDFDENAKEIVTSRTTNKVPQRKNVYPEVESARNKKLKQKFNSRFYHPERLNETAKHHTETIIKLSDGEDPLQEEESVHEVPEFHVDEPEPEPSNKRREVFEELASEEMDDEGPEEHRAKTEEDVQVVTIEEPPVVVATEEEAKDEEFAGLNPLLADSLSGIFGEQKPKSLSLIDQVRISSEKKKNHPVPKNRNRASLTPLKPLGTESHSSVTLKAPLKPLVATLSKDNSRQEDTKPKVDTIQPSPEERRHRSMNERMHSKKQALSISNDDVTTFLQSESQASDEFNESKPEPAVIITTISAESNQESGIQEAAPKKKWKRVKRKKVKPEKTEETSEQTQTVDQDQDVGLRELGEHMKVVLSKVIAENSVTNRDNVSVGASEHREVTESVDNVQDNVYDHTNDHDAFASEESVTSSIDHQKNSDTFDNSQEDIVVAANEVNQSDHINEETDMSTVVDADEQGIVTVSPKPETMGTSQFESFADSENVNRDDPTLDSVSMDGGLSPIIRRIDSGEVSEDGSALHKQVLNIDDPKGLELLILDKTGSPLLTLRSNGGNLDAVSAPPSPGRYVKKRKVYRVKKNSNTVSAIRDDSSELSEQSSTRKVIRTRKVVKRIKVARPESDREVSGSKTFQSDFTSVVNDEEPSSEFPHVEEMIPHTTRPVIVDRVEVGVDQRESAETQRNATSRSCAFTSLYLSEEELTQRFLESPAQYEDSEPVSLRTSEKNVMTRILDKQKQEDDCPRILPVSGMLGMLHMDDGLKSCRMSSSSRLSTRSLRMHSSTNEEAASSSRNEGVRFI